MSSGTTGCVFMDDFKKPLVLASASPVDLTHPRVESHVHPHPPGTHVQCRHAGINRHPANVPFYRAHPHFKADNEKCKECSNFSDCGQAEGKLPPGS